MPSGIVCSSRARCPVRRTDWSRSERTSGNGGSEGTSAWGREEGGLARRGDLRGRDQAACRARGSARGAERAGLVAGGRSKPWRQKGTGRARQGTIRAPQFAGGGVAFPPVPRDFSLKVNKKAARAALRAALSDHAQAGTLGLVAGDSFEAPSTKQAVELLQGWGQAEPTVVVATEDEETLIKSFRNLPRVLVTVPAELEVAHVVWARSLVVTEAALPLVQGRAAS
ncbi:MAG: 50S ribosomal protein L4 [Actinobacteria bacterium]|nr:MAG: 50S ribosomal protein L4 [Actinomycetota bacterium]